MGKRFAADLRKVDTQKQPSRCVIMKRCSENKEQIYKRTPMPKCDYNKVAKVESKLFVTLPAPWILEVTLK